MKVPVSDDQWWLTDKDGQTVEGNGESGNSDSECGSESDSGESEMDSKPQVNGGMWKCCLILVM